MSSYSSEITLGIAALSTVALSFSLWAGSERKKIKSAKNICRRFELEEDNSWLDQASFDVVTALCDTFIPSIESADLTLEKVNTAVDAIHPDLRKHDIKIDQTTIDQNRAFLCRGALDMNHHKITAEALEKLITKEERFQVYIMLKVLSTSAGCFMITGFPAPFQDLPLQYRVQALEALREGPLAPLRVFYQTFKRITGNLFFSFIDEHGTANVNWPSLHYDPAETVGKVHATTSQEERDDRYLRERVSYPSVYNNLTAGKIVPVPDSPEADTTDVLEVDVVVVGSGSGGGMMASQLAKAGLNVLVLEKGGYYRAAEFKAWRESEAFTHTFEKGGLCSTVEGNVLVLAGSCVGGGSTVNWAASLRTPEVVREDWTQAGLSHFRPGGEFDSSLDAVHGLLHVNSDCSHRTAQEEEKAQAQYVGSKCSAGGSGACEGKGGEGGEGGGSCSQPKAPFVVNKNNTLLWEGAEKLGFRPEKIPRNVRDCVDCGHCCHGCPYSSKQSTPTALFEPLLLDAKYQLEVIPHCHVTRVLYEDVSSSVAGADGTAFSSYKRAIGVEAEVKLLERNLADLSVGERLKYIEKFAGKTRKLLVKAKIVVSAAGSLHTPALLLRSQITHNGMVGQHLTLHPVLGCGGIFPGLETRLASGVSMGVVVRQPPVAASFDFQKQVSEPHSPLSPAPPATTPAAAPTGDDRYTMAMQTPPAHVGLMGILFPWTGPKIQKQKIPDGLSDGLDGFSGLGGGLSVKLGMLNWRHSATFLALPRDRSQAANRVTIDSQGHPVLHYAMMPCDTQLMLAGLEANLRFMRAAGARFIYIAHENFPWFYTGYDNSSNSSNSSRTGNITPFTPSDDQRFEEYIQRVRQEGLQPARMQIFSAHQMSSCRMAPSPVTGPTSPSGELYECTNLFVADGSVLPTSLGLNPMVTIESFAHMIAKNVVQKICAENANVAAKVRKFQESQQW